MNDDLSNIVKQFQVSDKYSNAIPYGSGNINDTFLVTCGNAGSEIRYVLQRINHSIFKDPPSMMENI
ncbi:MAG: mucin desulfatase, partial [Anaerohalosphaeraceae bacterium]